MSEEEICTFVIQTRGYLLLATFEPVKLGVPIRFIPQGCFRDVLQPLVPIAETTVEDFIAQLQLMSDFTGRPIPMISWSYFYRVTTD